jgi:hypothetical protein
LGDLGYAIVSGVVSGFAGVLGTYSLMSVRYLKRYSNPEKTRMESLKGEWNGTIEQVDSSVLRDVTIQISNAGKKIKAKIYYQTERGMVCLNTEGGFHSNSQIYLEYRNSDGTVIQYGSVILILSAVPKTMSGKFLGFGPVRGDVVSGSINLIKGLPLL